MTQRRDVDEERRKLFRKMEWVFVYAPPILAACIALFGGFLLALFVPLPGITLWTRWVLAIVVIFVIPVAAYLVTRRFRE